MTVEDDECLESGSRINLPISCNSWGLEQLLPLSLEIPLVLIGAGMVAPLTDDSPRKGFGLSLQNKRTITHADSRGMFKLFTKTKRGVRGGAELRSNPGRQRFTRFPSVLLNVTLHLAARFQPIKILYVDWLGL